MTQRFTPEQEEAILGFDDGPEKVTHWEFRSLRNEMRTARVAGPCGICPATIYPGERVRAHTVWFDGQVSTARYCSECCVAMSVWPECDTIFDRYDLHRQKAEEVAEGIPF